VSATQDWTGFARDSDEAARWEDEVEQRRRADFEQADSLPRTTESAALRQAAQDDLREAASLTSRAENRIRQAQELEAAAEVAGRAGRYLEAVERGHARCHKAQKRWKRARAAEEEATAATAAARERVTELTRRARNARDVLDRRAAMAGTPNEELGRLRAEAVAAEHAIVPAADAVAEAERVEAERANATAAAWEQWEGVYRDIRHALGVEATEHLTTPSSLTPWAHAPTGPTTEWERRSQRTREAAEVYARQQQGRPLVERILDVTPGRL
jgi:chromosome segregation ATPase